MSFNALSVIPLASLQGGTKPRRVLPTRFRQIGPSTPAALDDLGGFSDAVAGFDAAS